MSTGEKIYKCTNCGKIFSKEELELLPGIHCPYCGWTIIVKLRPPIAKKIKAI